MKNRVFPIRMEVDSLLSKNFYNTERRRFFRHHVKFKGWDDREVEAEIRTSYPIPSDIMIFTEKGEELNYNFFEHSLKPSLEELPANYMAKIREQAKKVYGLEAIVDFLERRKREMLQIHDSISHTAHLSNAEKSQYKKSINEINDRIEEARERYINKRANKLHFDIKKGEFLELLNTFLELGLIKGFTVYDLMRFAENHFTFKGNEEIKHANKTLNTYHDRYPVKQYDGAYLIAHIHKILGT